MQLRAFTVPIHDAGAATEEINVFLRANRILSVDRHFVQDGANSATVAKHNGSRRAGRMGGCLSERSPVDRFV